MIEVYKKNKSQKGCWGALLEEGRGEMKFETGKRYIVTGAWAGKAFWETLIEVKVLEISPSGKWVKLQFCEGRNGWEGIEDWVIVEGLSG